ncbi:GNAT family N-acetyltransferase [Salipaludibacillus keqinensis]|uniref:GNAT family N-acetyltransferase n=1 Tax=Salipaludibacillus keqinensis TaxID=2045207 RepID=A0A323T716_9BACI|nr:GNAT family N-acetyltransferase [Salipaludibacillus keqinensis]PYZ91609.1 GNAT family N-acetyltransferase [Salipaludibacillus keqinensis]
MTENITVRPYTSTDYNDLLHIQKEAFPPPFPAELWWSLEQIHAHVETFPEGAMLALWNGKVAGSATSLITTFDSSDHSWEDIADQGYIRQTHEPNGDTLYGIDICVRPDFRGKGIAKALYEARKQLVIDLGLDRYIAGCRIPGYYRFADKLTVGQYVDRVVSGELKDLVLSFMLGQGLTPVQIIPNYVDDNESLNYAVMVEWKNPSKRKYSKKRATQF